MAYFNIFCFFCSIRLGSIFVGIISFVQVVIPTVWVGIGGTNAFKITIKILEDYFIENNHKNSDIVHFLRQLEEYTQTYFIAIVSVNLVYLLACILVVIGAYILNKWLLIPYILLEIVRWISLVGIFCITMIVIKKEINLGALIASSVVGTFALIFVGYLWACVFSLFQVIFVVKSAKYRAIYGNDPLKPNANTMAVVKNNDVKRVKFFPSPDFDNDPTIKQKKKIISEFNHSGPTDEAYTYSSGQTVRARNEYNDIRNTYLKNRQSMHVNSYY